MEKILFKISLIIFRFLPLTKLYNVKRVLLRLCGFSIGKNVRVVSNIYISGCCKIKICENSFIGHKVSFLGNGSFTIEKNVDIAPYVKLLTGTHKVDRLPIKAAGTGYNGNIFLKEGCWIGANSTILPDVSIGKCSIIAAGSVVTKSVPDYCLYAGNPAVLKKKLI